MKRIYYLSLIVFSILFTGCFKDDPYIVPVPILQIAIPYSMYEYQTYYSLETQSVVSHNSYADWDLGFESSNDGYRIILNSSRFMYAENTFQTDFYSVNSSNITDMKFDNSSGDLDSTVFINWADFTDQDNPVFNAYVYIVDRGKDEDGVSFGFKKIVVEKLELDTFYIHFSNLDNSDEAYFKIPKDVGANFTLFSFDNLGELKTSEPEKDSWDICFTKYSTIIPDDDGVPTDYLVRGVLLNPYKNIEVALDKINSFDDILATMVPEYTYTSNRDAIGYNWKVFSDNFYEIRDDNTYILKNIGGLDFKLRFTGFYLNGEKGYPTFQLEELTNTL